MKFFDKNCTDRLLPFPSVRVSWPPGPCRLPGEACSLRGEWTDSSRGTWWTAMWSGQAWGGSRSVRIDRFIHKGKKNENLNKWMTVVKPVHNEDVKLQPLWPHGFWFVFGVIAACDAVGPVLLHYLWAISHYKPLKIVTWLPPLRSGKKNKKKTFALCNWSFPRPPPLITVSS